MIKEQQIKLKFQMGEKRPGILVEYTLGESLAKIYLARLGP